MSAFYNENDPKAAAWLRELIGANLIAPGVVDERSITEIKPDELDGYTQLHFFAGIGGWSLALRLAGWTDDSPVITASLPCQPFSHAGKQEGASDSRHLWPVFARLVLQRRFEWIFGEQVARAIGFNWFDGVSADLEGADYAVGAAVLGAHSVGAPHRRQRLYWMAHTENANWRTRERGEEAGTRQDRERRGRFGERGDTCRLADAQYDEGRTDEPGRGSEGRDADGRTGGMGETTSGRCGVERDAAQQGRSGHAEQPSGTGPTGVGLADTYHQRSQGRGRPELRERASERTSRTSRDAGGFWSDYDTIPCRDGKSRRIESGTFPLVARLPAGVVQSSDPGLPIDPKATAEARVMRLRGYGNAIVPELAAQFIQASLEAIES